MKKKMTCQDEDCQVVVVATDQGDMQTYKYGDRAQMVFDQLNLLGDTDIYTIRDEILPRIIKQIEHRGS